MSALASQLGDLRNLKKGPPCQMGLILAKIKADDPAGHDALIAALDDPQIHATRLTTALKAAGYEATVHSVRRHRKRGTSDGCLCS